MEPHEGQAGLELAVLLKTTLNFWSSCPHLPVSGIVGVHLHTYICVCWGRNPWLGAWQASTVYQLSYIPSSRMLFGSTVC